MGMEFMETRCVDFSGIGMEALVSAVNDPALMLDHLVADLNVELDNYAEDNNLPFENEEDEYAIARLYLIEQVKELFHPTHDYHRDVVLDNGWCITGGETYGDDPSESWDSVVAISYVENQLLDILGAPHPNPETRAMDIVRRMANLPDDEDIIDNLIGLLNEAKTLINY